MALPDLDLGQGEVPPSGATPWGIAGWASATLLSVLMLTALFVVDYVPTNDGPQHIFMSYAVRHLDDPASGYGRYLSAGTAFTGLGFDAIFGVAHVFLPWRAAVQATLAVTVLLWAWGFMFLAASAFPARRWLGLLGFASAFQWSLWMGLFPFTIATGFGFVTLGFALRRPRPQPHWRALIAAALFCQAVFHAFAAFLTGFAVAVIWMTMAQRRLREMGWLALCALPAIAVAWSSASAIAQVTEANVIHPESTRWLLLARGFVSGPTWRAMPLALLGLGALAAWIGRSRRGSLPNEAALFWVAGTLTVAAMVSPLHLPGWQFFGVRFVPMATLLACLLLPTERFGPRIRRATHAAVVGFGVASITWAGSYHRIARANIADALAGLDAPVRRSGARLPVVFDPAPGEPAEKIERRVPFVAPLQNIGLLYAVAQGGVPHGMFIGRKDAHLLTWRDPPNGPTPDTPGPELAQLPHPQRLDNLLRYGSDYDDLLIIGKPGDFAAAAARGFAVDFQQGNALIAHFVGCPVQLDLDAGADAAGQVIVAVGWNGQSAISASRRAPAAFPGPMPFPNSPCGGVWLRVLFDRNADGRASPGDRVCEGADQGGFLHHVAMREATRITCRIGREILRH